MPVEGAAMDWYERVRGQEGINTIILLSNSVVNSDVSLEGLTRGSLAVIAIDSDGAEETCIRMNCARRILPSYKISVD